MGLSNRLRYDYPIRLEIHLLYPPERSDERKPSLGDLYRLILVLDDAPRKFLMDIQLRISQCGAEESGLGR